MAAAMTAVTHPTTVAAVATTPVVAGIAAAVVAATKTTDMIGIITPPSVKEYPTLGELIVSTEAAYKGRLKAAEEARAARTDAIVATRDQVIDLVGGDRYTGNHEVHGGDDKVYWSGCLKGPEGGYDVWLHCESLTPNLVRVNRRGAAPHDEKMAVMIDPRTEPLRFLRAVANRMVIPQAKDFLPEVEVPALPPAPL